MSPSSLSLKLVRIGAAMLVLAMASIGLTLWVTWQLEGGAAAVNEAGRLRMQTWRLVSSGQTGRSAEERARLVGRFDESLALLRRGDPSRPLFVPWNDALRAQFAEVESAWGRQRPEWLALQAPAAERTLQEAEAFSRLIDDLVRAIEAQLSRLTAILNLFQFVMMVLAIAAAVIMLYTGYLYVIHPLTQLRQGLAAVEEGRFATRIEVARADEFGEVAAGFNHMAQTLESLYRGLEDQVHEQQQRLVAEHARRNALYEISTFLGETGDMTELAHGFAQQVRRVMQADAVSVRWFDEANQRFLMLASDCLPQAMVEAEHCLPAGACACGQLLAEPSIRIIPVAEVGAPPALPGCRQAGYESLVTVPVRLQQRVLGEIDLFYRGNQTPDEEGRALLDALARHLASAIEGLRAAALEREAAISEERAMLARELHDSIAQSLAFMRIQVQLLRQAMQRGEPRPLHEAVDALDEGVRESVHDVRELLVHFRTRTHGGEITQALQETLQKFEHQTGLPTQLDVQGDGLPLPADVQVQVLHVLQEALSNVRKHARARRVWLGVHKGPCWQFSVRDDGCGFDPDHSTDASHVGLAIMRERATRIGAALTVRSTPGAGTEVRLTLAGPAPLPRDNAPQEVRL